MAAGQIILNGVTLNPNMVWLEKYTSQKVAQVTQRTLGAKMVVYSGSLIAGSKITLQATLDHGWLAKSVVVQLLAMADVPGSTFVFSFNGVDYNVIFRHEEPPAVDFIAIVPRTPDADTDDMVGQIKLLTV